MKTKEKITVKALELFNQYGVKEVTLRKIALAIGISQGNLNYHFKTKSDIITCLYFELVEKMNKEMTTMLKEQTMLSFLYESSLVSMNILYEYRFILKNLYTVLASNVELKTHYLGLQKIREEQYLALFDAMITQKILRKEVFENEYKRLYLRINILGDNWINASSLYQGQSEHLVSYYHELLFEGIFPYLTTKGKKEFKALTTK